ncbi:hypothetical protein FH972_012392 [Carpinus fangiana]|uniref:Uncharacterized protein n=1 Tax=Carpinus fangiana TaxID=176857 RepID=A0A5N6R3P6_9ROSI|nr:hypothetical protein FH972_012392 [Carpinus fangiana]
MRPDQIGPRFLAETSRKESHNTPVPSRPSQCSTKTGPQPSRHSAMEGQVMTQPMFDYDGSTTQPPVPSRPSRCSTTTGPQPSRHSAMEGQVITQPMFDYNGSTTQPTFRYEEPTHNQTDALLLIRASAVPSLYSDRKLSQS